VADEDLAVEQRPFGEAERPELRDRGQEIAAVPIDDPETGLVIRDERPDAVPLQLEEVIRGIEALRGKTRPHRRERPRESGRGARRVKKRGVVWPSAGRSRHRSEYAARACATGRLRRFLARHLRGLRGLAAA